MNSPRDPFKRGRADEWTAERIGRMSVQEIKALRDNAERLNEPELVERCREALSATRARTLAAGKAARKAAATRAAPSVRTRGHTGQGEHG